MSSDVVLPGNEVETIKNLDIIELCTLNYDLPHYIPLSHTGRLNICNTLQLNVKVSLGTISLNRRMPNCTTVVQTANYFYKPEIRLNSPNK